MAPRSCLPLLVCFLFLIGCGGSAGRGSWEARTEDTMLLLPGAKSYGSTDVKKGDKVRASVTSEAGPVDVLLYLDVNGKTTDLGKKNQVSEATLEAVAPADGTLLLRVTSDKANGKARYKLERQRAGK